jgi:hypothetical protein
MTNLLSGFHWRGHRFAPLRDKPDVEGGKRFVDLCKKDNLKMQVSAAAQALSAVLAEGIMRNGWSRQRKRASTETLEFISG